MLDDLKSEAYEANIALLKEGLINLTFGNASAIDRDRGIIAIKPSGVAYEDLKPEDMDLIDLEGNQVKVLAGGRSTTIAPDQRDVDGFTTFMKRYKEGFAIEHAVVEALK
jgi:L-ribulose-5-phosphate 4-epimerase